MMAERRKGRILVIDDEMGPRESLRYLLKDQYEVLIAKGVDEGVALFEEHLPDLVILDIRMPGKSGIEGLNEIRQLDAQVSVVMLTGFGALETAQEALRLGATDYINKPFDKDEMRELVKKYVQRSMLERKRSGMLKELHEMNNRLVNDLAERDKMAPLDGSSAEYAHDMRNPLTIVQGYVDLLSRKISESKQEMGSSYADSMDYLDVIEQNVKRCCDLSQMWQKYGQHRQNDLQPVRVSNLMRELKRGIEPLAATQNVRVAYRFDSEDNTRIKASAAQMIRALHNIVCNAVQAVDGSKGRVHVVCEGGDDEMEIRVEDNGCGIGPEVMEKIFTPYFSTKPEGEGTGLGLVIAKKIVEEHGGVIDVESVPDLGTTVHLRFPVLAEVEQPAAVAS